MKEKKKATKKKVPYTKPEVSRVRLDAEVLLAAACKTATGPSFGGSPNRCHKSGSCVNSSQGS